MLDHSLAATAEQIDGGGAITAALIGVGGLIIAAILTAVFIWASNRSVRTTIGRTNGHGDVVTMLTTVIETNARQETELGLTRGMVEELGTKLQAHVDEDRSNFALLFGEDRS